MTVRRVRAAITALRAASDLTDVKRGPIAIPKQTYNSQTTIENSVPCRNGLHAVNCHHDALAANPAIAIAMAAAPERADARASGWNTGHKTYSSNTNGM